MASLVTPKPAEGIYSDLEQLELAQHANTAEDHLEEAVGLTHSTRADRSRVMEVDCWGPAFFTGMWSPIYFRTIHFLTECNSEIGLLALSKAKTCNKQCSI